MFWMLIYDIRLCEIITNHKRHLCLIYMQMLLCHFLEDLHSNVILANAEIA